jgi:hypothetical protein
MDDERALEALGRLARDGTEEPVDPERDAVLRARFVGAVAKPRARPALRWGLSLAAAVALIVAVVLWWPTARLGYTVEGASVSQGDYVAAPAEGIARIRFTDGSSAEVHAGASIRIAETSTAGARLVIEEGAAELSVEPRSGARWSVEAGPYVILVTGTRFRAAWSHADDRLRVDLHEGAVTVRGPLVPEGLSLRAGQVLTASGRTRQVEVHDASARPERTSSTPSHQADPDAPSAPLPEAPPAVSGATPAASASAGPRRSWSSRVAAGEFQGVLAEADERGVDAVLEQGSLDDVVALSDAARYGRRGDVARRALSAVRRRFPGSPSGKSAAFLLGRMADDGGSPGAAIPLYEAYLSESPNGTFAAEALGRRMRAVSRSRGAPAARPLAEDYLRRYPAGAYAAAARQILEHR